MNAQDYHGNSPLLKCAMNDSRDTVRRLLSSKAAIERLTGGVTGGRVAEFTN